MPLLYFLPLFILAVMAPIACGEMPGSDSAPVKETKDSATTAETSMPSDAAESGFGLIDVGAVAVKVTLKTNATCCFVSAENGGGGPVVATRTSAAAWETFDIIDKNGGSLVHGDLAYIRASNGNFLQVTGGTTTALNAGSANAGTWELFTIQKVGGGTVATGSQIAFKSSSSGRYISALNDGGSSVNVAGAAVGANENFNVVIQSSSLVLSALNNSIVSLGTLGGTSQCIDVPSAYSQAGLNLQQLSCNSSLAQMYRFNQYPDGTWRILSMVSGLCLDVEGASLNDGAPIQTFTCNGSNAQKFTLRDKGAGNIEIANFLSKKCVNIAGQGNGAPVQQGSCANSVGQSFRPIAVKRPLSIMPLGASITQGVGGTKAGTRGYLHTLLNGAKVSHKFVGSNTAQPGDLPADQRNHEGHPGWTIDDIPGVTSGITPRAAAWVKAVNPDYILILLGNNDIGRNYKVSEMGARMKKLIDIINNPVTGAAPKARILIATLPLINDSVQEAKAITYGNQIRTLVAEMKAINRNIDVVDVRSVITLSDLADTIHPNDAGHEKIAKMWFKTLLGQP